MSTVHEFRAGDPIWINDQYGSFQAATVTEVEADGKLHAKSSANPWGSTYFTVQAADVADKVSRRD